MKENKSFKERVMECAILYAPLYKAYFVDYEYMLCSEAFTKVDYYIIQSHKDNYQHLLGVVSDLSPANFYEKCANKSLTEDNISFNKKGQSETEVKGSIRRKINSFPAIIDIFNNGTLVEEDFSKNRIRCSVAAGKTNCTLGFTVTTPAKPMTLLKGNQLDKNKAKPIDLVLRRRKGEKQFSDIIVGDSTILAKYFDKIKVLLSEKIINIS